MSKTSKTLPAVDGYIRKNNRWQAELQRLRDILLDSPLTEDVKWRVPCYTFEGKNVAFLGAFKESCAFSFVKGALLKDPKGVLELPGANTQSARVIRITTIDQVEKLAPTLKAYIEEAIAIEQSGQKVAFKKVADFDMPEELKDRLDSDPALKAAFKSLTPGRQRAYLLHFSGAKQSKTRAARVEKCVPRILAGKGLDD